MPKFPEPPGVAELSAIPPVLAEMPLLTTYSRIFFAANDHPVNWDQFRYFGPTSSRFDHHLSDIKGASQLQARGIMYLATGKEAIPTCLAEVFQAARLIDRQTGVPVLASFVAQRPLMLLDLTGPFATAIGASMAINSGPRPRARRWAQRLYEAYPSVDGLLYSSSMYGNAPAIALFERARDCLPTRPVFHRELRDLVLDRILRSTANAIGYGLV